jgi:hypothetical protein
MNRGKNIPLNNAKAKSTLRPYEFIHSDEEKNIIIQVTTPIPYGEKTDSLEETSSKNNFFF